MPHRDKLEDPFKDTEVIGKLPPKDVYEVLEAIGEHDEAEKLLEGIKKNASRKRIFGRHTSLWELLGEERCWIHTAHTLGFIDSSNEREGKIAIINASQVMPKIALQCRPLKISLNAIRVADYPGGGMHQILFDFYARNQSTKETEHLHFTSIYRVHEGEHASVIGLPIFVGLQTDQNGLVFRCLTVNIKNEEDERLLEFLEGDIFKSGLKLLSTAQPSVGLFSEMAAGLTKGVVQRRRNVAVQDIHLGLDFFPTPGSAGLSEGTYVAVQVPERLVVKWNWENWIFDHRSGRVVDKEDNERLIPYNYIAFGISQFSGSPA